MNEKIKIRIPVYPVAGVPQQQGKLPLKLKWYTFGLKDWYTFKLKKTMPMGHWHPFVKIAGFSTG